MARTRSAFIFMILAGLAVVDCGMTIARRLVVGVRKLKFSANSVLVVSEVAKLAFSVTLSERKRSSAVVCETVPFQSHMAEVLKDSTRVAPVAVLYLSASLVSYTSLKLIPGTVFAAISQLKILTTAVFTVILLRRKVSMRKWRTLLLLTLSVASLTISSTPSHIHAHSFEPERFRKENYTTGASLCALQTLLTGFASVYMEMLLKTEAEKVTCSGDIRKASFDVWDRNIQLAIWSILVYSILYCFEGSGGFFAGWEPIIVFITILQAVGGILVALCVIYTSSIAKTIAVCASLVLTALLSGYFGDESLSGVTIIISFMVALIIFDYQENSEFERSSEVSDT